MGDLDGEWFEREDHPFLNHLILNKMLKHLRKKDLKECRRVCKTWNVSTIPFARHAFKVSIYGNGSTKYYRIVRTHTIEKFVEVFCSNQLGIPFTRFKFCTSDGVGQEFLQLCGYTIKSIKFLQGVFLNYPDFAELLKSTPNLERLEIPQRLLPCPGNVVKLIPENSKAMRLMSLKKCSVDCDGTQEGNKFCPTFLEELITGAQNISSLQVRDFYPNSGVGGSDHKCTSWEVLSLIDKLDRESFIQDLRISHNKRDHSEYAELLHKMVTKAKGLKLKRFDYTAQHSDQDNHAFQLVSLFKDTLESLRIYQNRCTSFIEFQKMPRLAELKILLFMNFDSRFVNLNKIFPVLQELKLEQLQGNSNTGNNDFFPGSEPCPNLKSLEIHISLTLNVFNQILTVFPNLTHLKIEVEVHGIQIETLRQIFSQMTQLTSLDISAYELMMDDDTLDCVLTGISTPLVQEEIEEIIFFLEEMTQPERKERILELRNQHCQLPSVVNLSKLRSLTVHLSTYPDHGGTTPCLTDLTGYLGFYSMKGLKELIVEDCELTQTCCEMLTRDMGLESWSFMDWDYKDIIPSEEN